MSGQQHPPVPETTPLPPMPPTASPGGAWGAPPSAPSTSASPSASSSTAVYELPAEQPSGGGAGWGDVWGAPPPAGRAGGAAANPKPWTMKRGLVVAGAATVLAAGAGVGAYSLASNAAAADGTPAAGGAGQGGLAQGGMPQDGMTQDGGGALGGPGGTQGGFANGTVPGQGGDFAPGGLGGMGSGISSAVHSEYVIKENGQYVTKVAQLGTVTDVSSGSVTVKSTDGFTRSYTLGDATAVGNQQLRRQQSSASGLTVADIAAGATVSIVAAKDGSAFAAESVQLIAAVQAGQTGQTS